MERRDSQQIDKIYFMVHPLAYAGPLVGLLKDRRGDRRELHRWCWRREREVRPRQDELVRNLKQNEALVLYPIGHSAAMARLENFARKSLGRRCVVLPQMMPPQDIISALDPAIKAQLADEVMRTCGARGYDWQAGEIKVILYSLLYADYMRQAFPKAGLTFDPQTVEAEAFGESFDGCVTTWTTMTASFLGLANPVEKNYDLSVPDLCFLMNARFIQRLPLGDHVSLYLWEDADGTPIGLFSKGSHRAYEPRYVAEFPLHDWRVTVKMRLDCIVWPDRREETKSVEVENGVMRVAVHTGSRLGLPKGDPAADAALCIFGHSVKMADFQERLRDARVICG